MALSGPINISVRVSTLNGALIPIEVWPELNVRDFKRFILDDMLEQHVLAGVNEDIAAVGCAPTSTDDLQDDATLNKFHTIRVCTCDGVMLQDGQTLESQLDNISTLYKFVFYKQADTMNDDEKKMAQEFDDSTTRAHHSMRTRAIVVQKPAGTRFVVHPVWGTGDRDKDILGVIYQHWDIEKVCNLLARGMNPMMVDFDHPVQIVDMVFS